MKRSLPPIHTYVELRADSVDMDKRIVTVRFYSGAAVLRDSLFDGPHLLSFSMKPKAAQLERFNAGAPLLDDHRSEDGVRAVLGVVERAWIEGGEGFARVRFSKRAEVEPVLQDVKDGILTNVSMGVWLLEVNETTKRGDEMPSYLAMKWEPFELSLVPVPADAGATILAADATKHLCRINARSTTVKKRMTKCPQCSEKLSADVEAECPHCEVNLEEAETNRAENERVGQIHRLKEHFKLDDLWAQKHIKAGSDHTAAVADGGNERAMRHPIGTNDIGFGHDYDSPGAKAEMMAEGLVARSRGAEPNERERRHYDDTMVELAFNVLSWTGKHRGLDPRRHGDRIVELALHTTSDYPLLLGNALNKSMQTEYAQAMPTYRQVCQEQSFNDFRAHKLLHLGDFPDLIETNEHGEIKYGTISENQEEVTAVNYARIYGISRHVMVNDDVGAFDELARKIARRVVNFENGLFYTLLTSGAGLGPTLSDTKTLFHADHSNVGTGTIDVTNVGLGVAAMMKQTGLDGVKLNVEPSVLLVSPDRLAVARQFVAQNLAPTLPSEANPFANLTALADANLSTAAPWYLFASPSSAPAFVYGYIGGMEGPRTDTRAGWEVEGMEVRVSLDFGVGAVDYRGAFRSTGA